MTKIHTSCSLVLLLNSVSSHRLNLIGICYFNSLVWKSQANFLSLNSFKVSLSDLDYYKVNFVNVKHFFKLYNNWWRWRDLNSWPHDYESCALTSWATSPYLGSELYRWYVRLSNKILKIFGKPISRVLSWTIIHLGVLSPTRSSNLPELWAGNPLSSYLVLLHVEFTMPWTVASHAVGSYPTVSPLPQMWRSVLCCTGRRLSPPSR